MKKIISMLLALACALTCAFALASCDEPDDTPTEPTPVYTEVAKDFITAYGATTATSLATTVKVTLNGTTLNAAYLYSKATDGSATLAYSYDRVPTLDDESTSKTGMLVRDAQGNVTGEGEAAVFSNFASSGLAVDIDSDKITNYEASGNVLRITVAAADTQAVFGKALGSDAISVITIANGKVDTIALNYTAQDGSVVEILTQYNPAF